MDAQPLEVTALPHSEAELAAALIRRSCQHPPIHGWTLPWPVMGWAETTAGARPCWSIIACTRINLFVSPSMWN